MKRAFTLIELLVVVGIIVVLVAILVPAMENGFAASQRAKCAANLSSIGKALNLFVGDSEGNRYPVTFRYYMSVGQLGTSAGFNDPNLNDSDKRPLNKYLGVTTKGSEVKAAQCPSDAGGSNVLDVNFNNNFAESEADNGTSSVFEATGNSYVEAYGSFGAAGGGSKLARTGVAFMLGTDPNTPTNAKPAASKIMFGDAPFYGENHVGVYGSVTGDKRNRWHQSDPKQRQFNLLFADYHVEFFSFGDPSKAGPNNIENIDGNGTPVPSTSGTPNPSRGWW